MVSDATDLGSGDPSDSVFLADPFSIDGPVDVTLEDWPPDWATRLTGDYWVSKRSFSMAADTEHRNTTPEHEAVKRHNSMKTSGRLRTDESKGEMPYNKKEAVPSSSFGTDCLSAGLHSSRPHLLLELSVPLLLLAALFSELLAWPTALLLYISFRAVSSDYGRRAIRTLPRDLSGLVLLIRIKYDIYKVLRQNQPIHAHFLRFVRLHPYKKCVIEVETSRALTFIEFNEHANKYANLFKSLSFRKDDVLALFMENGIEFFAAWLGLSKIGVVSAWINTNLKLEPLAHSVNISKCAAVVTTPSLLPTLVNAISRGLIDSNLSIFVVKGDNVVEQLKSTDTSKREYSLDCDDEPESPAGLDFQSVLCYIYTSGTTGNPKAAIIKHCRFYLMGLACGYGFGVLPSDRLYMMMPMYHSAAGILGACQVLIRGCSICVRKKFSARNFWTDCVRFECTVSQYIGEICRYLLVQPPSQMDRRHRVRLMFGNGLRPQIWREFAQRFGIKRIGELYGSTEGNSNLMNVDNRTGACGFMPIYTFLHSLYPIRLLKVDPESGELVRDSRGYCVNCKPGDTGEVVATIKEKDPLLRFEGYVNSTDTQKKIIRDCAGPGDNVFSSGDILYWDRLGYLYFNDRRGDTYRWRGENVSTTEVEGVLQPIKCILDATVFGVEVPGREGRAGMIGVALAPDTDNEEFIREISARLTEQLASYAIPVFLRICNEVDRTGTFKLKKTQLQRDGYDLLQCGQNNMFYWDRSHQKYEPLDEQMLARINSGENNEI